MRGRFTHRAVLAILLMWQIHVCLATESTNPNESTKYLDAVREFADNVLKYGRDTYGPKHTPLFVNGLNIHTYEPVKWISYNLEHVQCRFSCERYPDATAKRNDPRRRLEL